jgi:hypothetical protein
MIRKIKMGQRMYVVPNYGTGDGILGTVTGIERDENDNVVAVYIQPPFSHSVYLDLRDEGFSLVDTNLVPSVRPRLQMASC